LEKGVRQGSPLSALLFQLVTDDVQSHLMRKWRTERKGIKVAWREIECDRDGTGYEEEEIVDIMFADDETLVAEDENDLSQVLMDVKLALRNVGLRLSVAKCQWSRIRRASPMTSSKLMM